MSHPNPSTGAKRPGKRTAALPAAHRRELAALVERAGIPAAVDRCGVSRATILQALAGLAIRPGSAALILAAVT